VLRKLGLITISHGRDFSSVQKVFDKDGRLLADAYPRRISKFLNELLWMAQTYRRPRKLG